MMAFLFLFFTVVLSLCVVGLIVLALASILGSVRDDWKLKKPERKPREAENTQSVVSRTRAVFRRSLRRQKV
jgi:hypothetical protein